MRAILFISLFYTLAFGDCIEPDNKPECYSCVIDLYMSNGQVLLFNMSFDDGEVLDSVFDKKMPQYASKKKRSFYRRLSDEDYKELGSEKARAIEHERVKIMSEIDGVKKFLDKKGFNIFMLRKVVIVE